MTGTWLKLVGQPILAAAAFQAALWTYARLRTRKSRLKAPAPAGPDWLSRKALLLLMPAFLWAANSYTTWSDYGGSADSMQYSALKQIDKANVSHLELAWSYLLPGTTGRFGFNPLIVDGVMYVRGKDAA